MRIHKSVLLQETINNLLFKNTGTFVDCTLGSGGHSLELLRRLEKGILVAIDSDIQSVQDFEKRIVSEGYTKTGNQFTKDEKTVYLVQNNFANLNEILNSLSIDSVDSILVDLGWSSDQLAGIEGLSYDKPDSELDMRLDNSLGVKAADLLNILGTKALSTMFLKYADIYGKDNNFLVERIVDIRKTTPFKYVKDLLPILDKTARTSNPKSFYAKAFQALRIAVNGEYKNLEKLLDDSLKVLNTDGIFLVITFHSGEAGIVENFMRKNNLKSIFRKNGENYIVPTVEELTENLSSRSARLFGYRKVEVIEEDKPEVNK